MNIKENQIPFPNILELLFNSFGQNNKNDFAAICNEHKETIIECFPYWSILPVDIRKDKESSNFWVQCLIAVANQFDSMGYPELIKRLTGERSNNPVSKWSEMFALANSLSTEGNYNESNNILYELI